MTYMCFLKAVQMTYRPTLVFMSASRFFTQNSRCTIVRFRTNSILISRGKPITSHVKAITALPLNSYFHNDCDGDESDSETDSEEVSVETFTEPDIKTGENMLRKILYPGSSDKIIQELNTCESVQDVFDIIRQYKGNMTAAQASQAVLVLWDLQKIFYKVNSIDYHSSVFHKSDASRDILKRYICEMAKHEDFITLLEIVDQKFTDLSPDAITSILLYLSKMGISMKHKTIQKLVSRTEELIREMGILFPLTALSRFTVAVHSRKGVWPCFVWQTTLPLVLSRIDDCKTAQDFRLLTICLNNMHRMIVESSLESYKQKAEDLLDRKIITADDYQVVVKAINFLNYPHWSQRNTAIIRKLMLVLKGKVSQMDPKDLVYLHKVFQSQLEPGDLLEEIQKYADELLSSVQNDHNSSIDSVTLTDLLSCLVSFSSPSQKNMFEAMVQRHIDGASFATSMPALFMMLRYLKTANVTLCDSFWSRALANIDENLNSEKDDYKLLRVCHRYMHFNNNLGGTYRHREFERHMKSWLLTEVENGISGIVPTKFARIASFMIAYGSYQQRIPTRSNEMSLEFIADKIVEMAPQFNVIDCLNISRGLQVSLELHRHNMSPNVLGHLISMSTVMNNCARQQLKSGGESLTDVNMIMRAYVNRKGPRDTDLFSQMVERYETNADPLSSRLLRDVIFNLQSTSCLVPRMIDRMVDYVIENNSHILGDTAEKLLYLCYFLGYVPTNADVFLPLAAELIIRDKEHMSGLSLLQGALSLCFFQKLPETLIQILFTVEFLERLDDEISHCYSKATYPVRMRNHLMQLNRAVCLDYPDADVPWFHTKYCQSIASLEGTRSSSFHTDVLGCLTQVVGSKELVQVDVYSPYAYKIDFQVLLNEKDNPVRLRHQADSNIAKVAILLLNSGDFCSNVDHLKGQKQLQQRHLEILGFRVIGISANMWNSMYMSEPSAKKNYLHKNVWPQKVAVATGL